MNLNENPDYLIWPPSHYVFIEKLGPFQETAPSAWGELQAYLAEVAKECDIVGFTSLYRIEPQMIYRAGVMVRTMPAKLPAGLSYENFEGGKYARFTLVGPYTQLPEACGRVFEIVEKNQMTLRDDFFLENYLNDPKTTPEDQLATEILIPIA